MALELAASARRGAVLAARGLFVLAQFVVLYGVFKPSGGKAVLPWDKAEHFVAFFGLMLLVLVAFPRTASWRLGAILSAEGAAIEIIQGLPLVGRDADVWDWVADTIGILAVIAVVLATRIRRTPSDRPT